MPLEEACHIELTKRYEALSDNTKRLLATLDVNLEVTRAIWQRDFYKAELLKIMIQYDDLKEELQAEIINQEEIKSLQEEIKFP